MWSFTNGERKLSQHAFKLLLGNSETVVRVGRRHSNPIKFQLFLFVINFDSCDVREFALPMLCRLLETIPASVMACGRKDKSNIEESQRN